MIPDELTLEARTGLPEPLRVLVREYPREGWAAHENFQGIVQFWLERHTMFRKLMDLLREDAEALIDERLDPQGYAPRRGQYGGLFGNEAHGHHTTEEMP